jgi:hypothetical protein
MAGIRRFEDLHCWRLSVELRDRVHALTESASLLETRNCLYEGRTDKYFSAADVEPLLRLQARAAKATLRLTQYLESLPEDFDITGGARANLEPPEPPEPPEPD